MIQTNRFRKCIWIINALRTHKALTLDEMNEKWMRDAVDCGKPLSRTSFNRNRDYISDSFGIIIECEPKTYKYYISNKDALTDGSIERWIMSTMAVQGVLTDSASIKDRVILENVPAGEEFLSVIVSAMRTNRQLLMGYQKFGAEAYEKMVCPYALKLFHQRWYMLARTADNKMRIYSLDRMTHLETTEEAFVLPEDFSPQAYFAEYFGVLTDGTPMAHVVVRAHKWTPNYLRTLPLHHSQREIASTSDYADFAFDIRPTADFIAQLLSQGDGIEVLEPKELREKMKGILMGSSARYMAE